MDHRQSPCRSGSVHRPLSPLICTLAFLLDRKSRSHCAYTIAKPFVDCSDMQVFPPDTVNCLGIVKTGQGGLLQLGGLITVTDRLCEAQDLVFA